MRRQRTSRQHRGGFMLMEVLLAFAIFSMAVTGMVIALNQTAELSQTMTRELETTRTMRNLMIQTLTTPVPEDEFVRDETIQIDAFSTARIQVTEFEQVNDEGNDLPRLYKINISLETKVDAETLVNEIETIHYYPLTQ